MSSQGPDEVVLKKLFVIMILSTVAFAGVVWAFIL